MQSLALVYGHLATCLFQWTSNQGFYGYPNQVIRRAAILPIGNIHDTTLHSGETERFIHRHERTKSFKRILYQNQKSMPSKYSALHHVLSFAIKVPFFLILEMIIIKTHCQPHVNKDDTLSRACDRRSQVPANLSNVFWNT